jgi:esterase/lipase superfamily enzyme
LLRRLAIALPLLLSLIGCASKPKGPTAGPVTAVEAEPPPPPPVSVARPAPQPRITHALPPPTGVPLEALPCEQDRPTVASVNVYYATNRKRSGSKRAEKFYGSSNANVLDLGIVRVTIPPKHRCGKIESPQLSELRFVRDENRDMVLKEVRPLQPNVYFASISQKVARSERHELFVFIHGFNNTFEDAALRAAELAFDLDFQGAPIVYSWPAVGGGATGAAYYFRDRGVAKDSAPHLRHFLNLLADRTGAEAIHVVVHSMGNYVLQNALSDGNGNPRPLPKVSPKLHEVVLAAADLSAGEIKTLAAALRNGPDATRPHVTLYASSNDKALLLSRKVNGRPPIGLIAGQVPAVAGIDVVDASTLTSDFLGHAYFAEDPFSLREIRALITEEWETAKRAWLAAKEGHWYFCGEACPIHGH